MTDQKLVDDFLKNRSEEAFSRLYRLRTPRLYQIALRLVAHNEELAQELIQETWVIAIRKLPEFQWKSKLNTWLTAILINLNRQARRKQEKQNQIIEDVSVHPVEKLDIENSMDLEQAISLLPPGYRQIIILHDIEGYIASGDSGDTRHRRGDFQKSIIPCPKGNA